MTQSKSEETMPGARRRFWRMTLGRPSVRLGVVLLLAAASGIGGCVYVDRYSDRAVQYNREAEQVQDQDLLLNVLRASQRRPLQFSGVQTVSGNGTASGTLAGSWPMRKGGGTTPTLLSPSTTFSGGPTFAVGILDTQDFYKGILNPIPLNILDLYYQERYSSTMLFNLFIQQIVIKQTDKITGQTNILEIPNNVGRDQDFDRFQTVLDYLLNLGLSTESKPKATAVGAVLTADEAADLKGLSRAATAGLDVKEVKWCDLAESDRRSVLARLPELKSYPALQQQTLSKLREICDPPTPEDLVKSLGLHKTESDVLSKRIPITCGGSESDWRTSLANPEPARLDFEYRRRDALVKQLHKTCDDYQNADILAGKVQDNLPNLPSALYRAQKPDKSLQLCFRPLPSGGPPADQLRLAIANSIAKSAAACGGTKQKTSRTKTSAQTKLLNKDAESIPPETAPGQLGFKALTLGPEIAERLNAIDSDRWRQAETKALGEGKDKEDFPWPVDPEQIYCQQVCQPTKDGRLSGECNDSVCSKYGNQYGNVIDFAKEIQIELAPRSTEGIIYYLGEIVRRETGPQDLQDNKQPPPRTIAIQYNPELYRTIPDTICLAPPNDNNTKTVPLPYSTTDVDPTTSGFRCEPLFVLSEHYPVLKTYLPILAVTYDGKGYKVPPDKNVAGRTPQVMDMTLQLIGLFKSAKNLPTTSVFTLIGTP